MSALVLLLADIVCGCCELRRCVGKTGATNIQPVVLGITSPNLMLTISLYAVVTSVVSLQGNEGNRLSPVFAVVLFPPFVIFDCNFFRDVVPVILFV